jgi:prophage regulatory protein
MAKTLTHVESFEYLVSRTLGAPSSHFPSTGFVRLSAIIAPHGPIPVGKSTWWQGVRDGRFPKPLKLGPKTTVWRVEDILALIARLNATQGAD